MRATACAGAFLGFATAATACWLAASSLPFLTSEGWLLVLAGAVFACSLGGMGLALCLSALGDVQRGMDLAYGALERARRETTS